MKVCIVCVMCIRRSLVTHMKDYFLLSYCFWRCVLYVWFIYQRVIDSCNYNRHDNYNTQYTPPKNAKIALQTPRTSRLSTFYYCQVVNWALLRLLSTYILVLYRVLENYNIKSSNILYHWLLSMASFRFFVKHIYYTSNRSWSTRVRFLHSWAEYYVL